MGRKVFDVYSEIGNVYNHLTIIKFVKTVQNISRKHHWYECKCDCGRGKKTVTHLSNLKTNHTMSCGCKKTYKHVEQTKQVLNENGILWVDEKRYEDLKNTYKLPYDFVIYDKEIKDGNELYIIEIDGEDHFMPVYRGTKRGKSELELEEIQEKAEQKFENRKNTDRKKNQYAKNIKNIPIIRIPTWIKLQDLTVELCKPETSIYTLTDKRPKQREDVRKYQKWLDHWYGVQ